MLRMTNAYSLKLLLISPSVMASIKKNKKHTKPLKRRIPHIPATYWFCNFTPFYKAMAVFKALFKTLAIGLRRHKNIPNEEEWWE